jgi:hypothetical protein
LFILFGVPVLLPAIFAYVAIKTVREALAQSIEAWKPEPEGPTLKEQALEELEQLDD